MTQLGLAGLARPEPVQEPDTPTRRAPRPKAHHHLGLPDRCPRKGCGRDLEWYEVGATNGLDPEWLDSWAADCRCGLHLYVRPDGQASLWPRSEPG